ncbi:aminotransferase class I/II-fold pyridoxal phosphate-dependent enzyme [Streptomyces sp. SKN60]|uniref:aminotransferase class I/II-fold pyridoxal phosphate-dependent enzyme n=1 Tax=Streptomyces sp. SKN60 TaxID=2855506 RepID=UPI002246ABAD|nr:aminotransferase class I/II-fold pyridoxal phosphate-dependent enzyme [Streptomyces sp. SKN60]MCX2183938.1 aminotransferase class I/II-fold pyridoxal phosphate-dependent enzyme [Streptomyces sp. SKN60]
MATQYSISGTTAKGIAASVERGVSEGELAPGDALPPVRRLADELGVSPGTVATAYKELRRRGLVVTRGRGGTVVAEAPSVASRRPPRVPEGLVDLAGGHPDPAFLPVLHPPAEVRPVFGSHRAAPRLAGLEELTRAWYARDGVPAERVSFAHGALDCIARLLSVELRPGDAVAVEDPGFHHLLDLVPALGLRMVPVAVDREGITPDALRTALRAGVRAVVCTPRAQNPTGASLSPARRDALVELLREFPEVLVVEDDYTAELSGPAAPTLAAAGLDRWAQVRTVSKRLGVDLRWAGVAGDPVTIARHDGRMLMTSGWVSHVLQETVAGLLTDPATVRLVAAGEAAYAERRGALAGALRTYGIRSAEGTGMNLWVPVRDESAVVNGLRTQGWWVAAGARFRIAAPTGVRITTAALDPADAERLAADFAAVLGDAQATYGG